MVPGLTERERLAADARRSEWLAGERHGLARGDVLPRHWALAAMTTGVLALALVRLAHEAPRDITRTLQRSWS